MEETTTTQEAVPSTEACFVGPRKVLDLEPMEVKTYEGTIVLLVNYEGGFSQLMTQKTFNAVKTFEPKDYNYIRDTKFKHVTRELYPLIGEHFAGYGVEREKEEKGATRKDILSRMMSVCCEYDVTVGEMESLLQIMIGEANALFSSLGFQMDNSYDRATNFLWTGDDKTFVPGYNQSNDLTLVMAKRVIDGIPVPEDKEEVKTEDGQEPANTTE